MKPLALDIEEIRDAIEMLQKFEANLPSVGNIDDFRDGIEMLNDYLIDYPETPHINFINNQKIAYTRRVLQSLKSIDSSELIGWLNVVVALFAAEGETQKLLKSNPEFKKDYDDFIAEWKDSPQLSSILSNWLKSR